MLKKINKEENKGFTIVETLIVLAVSSFLFAIISVSIAGQVQRYRHRDAMYRLQQEVQNVINDVQTGRFNVSSNGDSPNTFLIGKKILFCLDNSSSPCSSSDVTSNGPLINQSQYKVNITIKTESAYSLARNSEIINLPDRVQFVGSLTKTPSGEWVKFNTKYLGFDIRMEEGDSSSSTAQSVNIYNYANYSEQSDAKFAAHKICFRSSQIGSLELGGTDPGSNVKMLIQDDDCKRVLGL